MIHLGDYRNVLSGVSANLIFTSPPYNIGSHALRRDGFRPSGRFDPKSFAGVRGYRDSLVESKYQDQQTDFLVWCADHLAAGGTVVYNVKPRRRSGRLIHPSVWFNRKEVVDRLTLMEEIVWNRGSTHQHGKEMMWPQTERLYVFRRAGDRYTLDNVKGLPFRSDVWHIPIPRGRNRFGGHCAPFPEELMCGVVLAWSKPGDLVVDPYSGSGTTAVVAHRLGRKFECAEILKTYYRDSLTRLKERA